MPYIVREGDPLPWFQSTSNALGSLIDVAMNDRRNAQGAAREEAQYGRQRQASAEDFTRNREAQQADYATRRTDENARDLRNFGQTKELQGQSQAFQQQLAEARRQQEMADAEQKRTQDLAQGEEFLRASGLAQEVPGSMLFENPPTQVPRLGLEASKALAANKRMMEQNAAMMQERAIDNERMNRGLTQRGQQFDQTQGFRERQFAEQLRANQAREAQAVAKLSPMDQAKVKDWDDEISYLYRLLDDPETAKKPQRGESIRQQIEAASQQKRSIIERAMVSRPQAAPTAAPNDISDDELDARLLGG